MENGFVRVFVSKLLSIIGTIAFIAAVIGLIIGFSKGFTGGDIFLISFLCVNGLLIKKGAKKSMKRKTKQASI